MASETCPPDPHTSASAAVEILDTSALITHNNTALPEVYDAVYSTRTTTPPEISSSVKLSRQVVHQNLERLVDAGLVRREESTYHLIEPTLRPTVVQSLSELGSLLRLELCTVAVDRERLTVADARGAVDRSTSNTRKILNALADDGYLGKRASLPDEGHLVYQLTEHGTHALESLEEPTRFCDRDGATVTYHSTGIEGTAFRTAYEIEDAYLIARHGGATVIDLLAGTDKEEKAMRRRLNDLAQRDLLTKTRRRTQNVYRRTPRTRTMVESVRACEDDRRLHEWSDRIPDGCREGLLEPFFPTHLFDIFSTLLHDPQPDLADEYIKKWKAAGLIDGNRHSGFRIIHPDETTD